MNVRVIDHNTPILEIGYAHALSQAIYIAVKMQLPKELQGERKSCNELAESLKDRMPAIDEPNLYRLLRNLATIGVFHLDKDDKFSLGILGQELLNFNVEAFILNDLRPENWMNVTQLGENNYYEHCDQLLRQDNPGHLSPALFEWVNGYRYTKSLYLFAKLHIADRMGDNALTINQLADESQQSGPAIAAICYLLSGKNILFCDSVGRYSLTESGKLLKIHHQNSLLNFVLHENIARWKSVGALISAVTEGKIPFEVANQSKLFDAPDQSDPNSKKEFDIFNQAMAEISRIENKAIVRHLEIPSHIDCIMDVGGGTGALMKDLLRKHTRLDGIVFDQPDTVQRATFNDKRCRFVGGDFFKKQTIPHAQTIILKRTLHDWSNEKAIEILKNCAEKSDSLRVIEWLWVDKPFVACLDFILMGVGGKIRSLQEFEEMMQAANISCRGAQEIASGIFILHGDAAQLEYSLESQSRPTVFSK